MGLSREAQINLAAAFFTLLALMAHPSFLLAALGLALASLYIQRDRTKH